MTAPLLFVSCAAAPLRSWIWRAPASVNARPNLTFGTHRYPRTAARLYCIAMEPRTAKDELGYDENFVGVPVPLPTFSENLNTKVVKNEDFHDETWARRKHYSVCTNWELRQPVCTASNIAQDKLRNAGRSKWEVDREIGAEYQLNNDYYYKNVWDRGHMVRRAANAWGDTDAEADEGSDATMLYTNAALQHENLNQDEWLEAENWIKDRTPAENRKVSVFTGPIYGALDQARRFITPRNGRPSAEIPAAFFKIACFVGKDGSLSTRAFIFVQDRESLRDKFGKRKQDFELNDYQVTVKQIEDLTGLRFDPSIAKANPLYATSGNNDSTDDEGPEMIEIPVTGKKPIIDSLEETRPTIAHDVQVYIGAAMINPAGQDRGNEWVSIANFTSDTVSLDGWTLSDTHRDPLVLSGELQPGAAVRFEGLESAVDSGSVLLSNKKGTLILSDKEGREIDRVGWKSRDVRDGRATVFKRGTQLFDR